MNVKISSSLFKCPIICLLFYYITLVDSYFVEKDDYRNELHDMLLKRRNPTGLIPFPRVGKRGYPKWRLSDLDTKKRREGLIPFPRVGKSLDHSKAKLNDEDEFLLAWIGPKWDRSSTNPVDFNKKNYFGRQLPDYMHKLLPNEKEVALFSGERLNPSKSIDEFVLPDEIIINPNNEQLSINGNKKQEQESLSSNIGNDGWHNMNLEHVIE